MALLKDHEIAHIKGSLRRIKRRWRKWWKTRAPGTLTATGTVALAILGILQALIIKGQLEATK
jgi:hypothetical protein